MDVGINKLPYQTSDGSTFATRAEARRHVENLTMTNAQREYLAFRRALGDTERQVEAHRRAFVGFAEWLAEAEHDANGVDDDHDGPLTNDESA